MRRRSVLVTTSLTLGLLALLPACTGSESDTVAGSGGSVPTACSPEGAVEYCYEGPAAARGVGECNDGTRECAQGVWGACEGYGLPVDEICDDYLDNNCNGVGDEGCSCDEGSIRPCYTGPAATRGIGMCSDGEQACSGSVWDSACVGEALPAGDEPCNELDDNCNGVVDDGCSCTEGASRGCFTGPPSARGVGECTDGAQSCIEGEWDATCADEVVPQPEQCNGRDDDCDGQTDEDLSSTTCGLGPCAHTVQNCINGVPQTCDPLQGATTETCDGQDNNCDGTTDEGCNCVNGTTQPCYTGQPGTQDVGPCHGGTQSCSNGAWGSCNGQVTPVNETCNGVDDNCNGSTDDGLGTTNCGVGPCAHTQQNCVGGQPRACDPYLGATSESCNNIDDNCNGSTDDGLGTTSCGVGPCAHTQQNCVGGATQTCNPLQGATTETCNGVDDDCDGSTDESLGSTNCGVGVCAHTQQNCVSGVPRTCNPLQGASTEVCDGADNDCDGSTDEGLGSTTCGVGVCAHSQTNCVGGVPQTCNPMQGSTSETCDGLDNDCDGTVDDGTNLQLCGDSLWYCYLGQCYNTCPVLYTWNGNEFGFEADMYGSGKLGVEASTGILPPQPNDYYVLQQEPAPLDDQLELRIVEERNELNYFDALTLYAADFPAGLDLYAELHGVGAPDLALTDALHTVSVPLEPPLAATHVNTGDDVLTQIAASDGVYALFGNDRNLDFDYNTVELDLGDLSSAPQIKLVIDAITAFPSNPDGIARKKLFGPRTKLEVADGQGGWLRILPSQIELAPPKEVRRPFALDLTGAFPSSTYRVRLTFLFKTYLDAISLDTTADVPVTLEALPLASAHLGWYGQSERVGVELFEYVYGAVEQITWPAFSGFYTDYGDVTPLLTAADDKYVIFWGGEEVAIRFEQPQSALPELRRRYLVHAVGYYKDASSSGPKTVEPLPFEAMSNYPYDLLTEQYPNDPDHAAYRQTYNTRWLP